MRRLLSVWLLLASGLATAAEVKVPAEQWPRLGLKVETARAVDRIPLGRVPAQVTVPPANDRLVTAPLAGRVVAVSVARGDAVRAGQVLAVLESPELLQHQQHLLDAWHELQVAEARYRRERSLYRAGVIPKSRWQETEKRWHQARTAYRQARRELELIGLEPRAIDRLQRTARLDSRLALRAPAAAAVRARLAVVGQRVGRADPLVRLIVPDPLWLELAVPVALADRLGAHTEVEVPGQDAHGRVIRVGTLVEPANQTVPVRALLDRPAGLRPGRRLEARLVAPATGVVKLPRAAVVEHQGRYFVFVRRGDGFEVRPVTPLHLTTGAAYLKAGVRPGEAVAVSATAALKAAWLGVGEEE